MNEIIQFMNSVPLMTLLLMTMNHLSLFPFQKSLMGEKKAHSIFNPKNKEVIVLYIKVII